MTAPADQQLDATVIYIRRLLTDAIHLIRLDLAHTAALTTANQSPTIDLLDVDDPEYWLNPASRAAALDDIRNALTTHAQRRPHITAAALRQLAPLTAELANLTHPTPHAA